MKEENIVMPDYKHCILGTITSILKYYNVDSKHKSSEKIDKILNEKNYKKYNNNFYQLFCNDFEISIYM